MGDRAEHFLSGAGLSPSRGSPDAISYKRTVGKVQLRVKNWAGRGVMTHPVTALGCDVSCRGWVCGPLLSWGLLCFTGVPFNETFPT